MQIVYLVLATPVLLIVGIAPILATIYIWRLKESQLHRESPISKSMLRPPGHSLAQKLDDNDVLLNTYIIMSAVTPALALLIHVCESYFFKVSESLIRSLFSLGIVIIAESVLCWRISPLANERKRLILGLEGERFTAEELNLLMLDGCRVFHDIPFPYGNIDHIVISVSGIFCVNSKAICKPKMGQGRGEVVVDHNQNIVRFPDRTYPIPLSQFATEANWLEHHLTSSVGQPFKIESILALPGWFIKARIGRGPVYVINPINPRRFFVRSRQNLSAQMIQQAAHQIEQLCRNLEPSFRQNKGWASKDCN